MNRRNIFAFLLGFTVWMPLLFLAYDLNPYRLVITGEQVSVWGEVRVPMWGWELRKGPTPPELVMGSYTGLFALAAFYACYIAIVVAVYFVAIYESKKVAKEAPNGD